ncbi:hypothetical protein HZU67_05147 [Apis mellifera carnica]|nr:hypothetical protein HZU67_05147 [Apis mellifera carnica]
MKSYQIVQTRRRYTRQTPVAFPDGTSRPCENHTEYRHTRPFENKKKKKKKKKKEEKKKKKKNKFLDLLVRSFVRSFFP